MCESVPVVLSVLDGNGIVEDGAFPQTPVVQKRRFDDQQVLLCTRVTLRTPGRVQAYAVVLQTRLGLGGDIFDKVPTGKKDLTVRLYFSDYLAGFG